MKEIRKNLLLYFSVGILLLMSFFSYFLTEQTYTAVERFSKDIRSIFGPFYLWLGLGCVLFLILIAFSPLGKKKLGIATDVPEFSRVAWISMLYSAGMGSGILLRAVQEPVFMFLNPPLQAPVSNKIIALEYTFYQWGFTAWAFYALFAIILGYYGFVKARKIRVSSIFQNKNHEKTSSTILKSRSNTITIVVDLLVILTTIFGLVAAIALGTTQISGGIQHIYHTEMGLSATITILLFISLLATISVYKGIHKGIKVISTWNIYITLALLFFVLIQNDIWEMVSLFLHSLYQYVINFIPLSLAYGTFNPGTEFLTDWTYYYWAFWIAWAPFTGMFIARISKGRTLREIIIGVLLIPSMGTFFWFSVFGHAAFDIIHDIPNYQGQFDNVFSSIFVFFENYPFSRIINIIVAVLLVSFLITSLDSAIYILSMFSDQHNKTSSKKHRIIWSILLTIFAVGILFLGNSRENINVLTAMQKLLIITSLPLSFLMLSMIFIFSKDIFLESKKNTDS